MSSLIGRTIARYQTVSEISRGGMGVVYRAWDLRLNREVAFTVQYWGDGERDRENIAEARKKIG